MVTGIDMKKTESDILKEVKLAIAIFILILIGVVSGVGVGTLLVHILG